jgi:quinol monooxygenase YgiN
VVVDILTYFDVHLIDKGRQKHGMVTEIAIFTAAPGKEEALGYGIIRGLEAIRHHPECISANATRCVERDGRYMLSVVWTSLEAHMKDFRSSPLYSQWRSHIEGLFEDPPEVYHYQPY